MEIVEIAQDDVDRQRAWYETMRAAWTDGRPFAIYQPFEPQRAGFVDQPEHERRVWLAAVDDRLGGEVVGAAEIGLETEVNLDRAVVEIGVAAGRRREGIGRRLFEAADVRCRAEGRSRYDAELYLDSDDSSPPPDRAPGRLFAQSLGYRVRHTELHLVLPLTGEPQAGTDRPRPDPPGYRTLTWIDRCPDDQVAGFLATRTQMDADVPAGEEPPEHRAWTPERLRAGEQRMSANWVTITAAARHETSGELVGYSELLVPRSGDRDVWQDDTLVMPGHRGHRLGLALKLATLELLRRDHPDAAVLHTWTDPENAAMLQTNRTFGYVQAEVMHEVLREAPPVRSAAGR